MIKKSAGLTWVKMYMFFLFLLTGCGGATGFVPAPPPVDSKNVMNINQLSISDAGQLMSITSPTIDVVYRENGNGVGKTVTEIIELPDGTKGTMLSVVWGDWENAGLDLVNYYDQEGNLIAGIINAEFIELSLFQLFNGHAAYTLDRSNVMLAYAADPEGIMRLKSVSYFEKWGPGSEELAFGGYAMWTNDFAKLLPPAYQVYGFWETNGTPGDQVMEMIEAAMDAANRGVTPEFKAVDQDSGREVFGRQTGLTLYKDGQYYGYVDFDYANTWGRQSNTPLIGAGALSRIGWHFGPDGATDYYMVVLSPRISPIGSAVYVFTDNVDTANLLGTKANADTPSKLYAPLRQGEYSDVFLSLYSIGDIGSMIEGSGDSTTYVGDSGGVQWRSIGNADYADYADYADFELASNLLALLGPAQYQNGLYYAYAPGSGSGMSYYLAALRLMYAPEETVFRTYGQDVGVLDRVLIPDLDFLGITTPVSEP